MLYVQTRYGPLIKNVTFEQIEKKIQRRSTKLVIMRPSSVGGGRIYCVALCLSVCLSVRPVPKSCDEAVHAATTGSTGRLRSSVPSDSAACGQDSGSRSTQPSSTLIFSSASFLCCYTWSISSKSYGDGFSWATGTGSEIGRASCRERV